MAKDKSQGEAASAEERPQQRPAPEADPVATPEEHAVATGNAPPPRKTVLRFNGRRARIRYSAAHEAAAVLHGWAQHANHSADPLKLPRSAYEAALEAASKHVDDPKNPKRHGQYVPHAPALAPHRRAKQ